MPELGQFVAELAGKLRVPGVAVGTWADGEETYSCNGVTSLDNPLPVNQDTMFVLGSVSKPFTATALMCLVAEGRVALDGPVRRYVPELALADAGASERITVLQLLNHTAGFATHLGVDTGEGDGALAEYVAAMAVPTTAPASCPRTCCRRCSGRALSCRRAPWATRSGCAGSCVTWAVWRPSATAARPTVSSPTC